MRVMMVFLLVVGLSPLAHARSEGGSTQPPLHRNSEVMVQKLVELRGRLLREMVGLSEARAAQAERVLERFDPEHHRCSGRLDSARREVRRLLDEDSDDADAYAQAVEALRVAHDALHSLRDRQFRAMQEVLQPKEQALFFESLGRLRHEVKKRMRRAKRHRKP